MITLGLVALIVVAFIAALFFRGGPKVAPHDAKDLVDAGATLLDVRSGNEYDLGHFDGALNIPVQALARRLDEVSKDKPVVVYCMSGIRSARASALLKSAGYDVFDLGAMTRWPDMDDWSDARG